MSKLTTEFGAPVVDDNNVMTAGPPGPALLQDVRGDFPRWTLYIQVIPESDANTYRLNPFDLTKVWPQSSGLSCFN